MKARLNRSALAACLPRRMVQQGISRTGAVRTAALHAWATAQMMTMSYVSDASATAQRIAPLPPPHGDTCVRRTHSDRRRRGGEEAPALFPSPLPLPREAAPRRSARRELSAGGRAAGRFSAAEWCDSALARGAAAVRDRAKSGRAALARVGSLRTTPIDQRLPSRG